MTNAAIIPAAGTLMQPAALGADLMRAFVEYIDRSANTARTYIINLRQFFAFLKYKAIPKPVRADIITYKEWLGAEHDAIQLDTDTAQGWSYRTNSSGKRFTIMCSPNTIKQYLQSVKQFFSWTAAEGRYPNIAANIHAPKVTNTHRKDSLTPDEVQEIERSITANAAERAQDAEAAAKDTAGRMQRTDEQGKRLYAMYLLAVNAGLRTIEISRANIKDIEVKNGKAILYVWGKGHTAPDTKKPLAPAVYEAIADYLNSRSDNPTNNSPLFAATGNRSGGQRIAPTTISKMLKRAMQAAGYDSDRLTAHSLRHTAGQAVMALTDNNIYKAQQYMRHSNPATTEIYLENDTTTQDANIAAELYDYYHGGRSAGGADTLADTLQRLTPDKLEKLKQIAEAMAG
jgi:integrase/recombinase XerD